MTSHIRIPDVSPVTQALADGARSVFPFSFPIFQAGDIEVRANSTLVATGYTVVGEGSSTGGAVIFTDAPASGVRITLRRRQTYARTDDFLDERAPTPHELNDAVDRNVAALQELDEQVSRSVRRPLSADLSQPLDLSLPAPEAGKAIGWNGSADALVNLAQADVPDFLRKSQNLADLPDTVTARNNLGLGSAALRAEGDFATAAQGARADSALQSSDIGNSVQAHDGDLDWVAANLTTAGRALIDDADASAQRATLGLAIVASSGAYVDLSGKPVLGSAAAKDVGVAAGQVVMLDDNAKLPAVDGSALTGLGAAPTGLVSPFAGASAPAGWLACDGSAVSRSTYAALFTVLGTIYGAGNGTTTFNLPDLRGRTVIGVGQGSSLANRMLGGTVGEETHTLTTAEIPSHTHTVPISSSGGYGWGDVGGESVAHPGSAMSSSAGGGASHNNMQPSLVLHYIIKT